MIISIMINMKMITVLFHILDLVYILYLQHISAPTSHVQVGLVAAAAGQGNFTVLNPHLGWSHRQCISNKPSDGAGLWSTRGSKAADSHPLLGTYHDGIGRG